MQRNYNNEIKDNSERKYSYSFDTDIIQPFMVKSFEAFFKDGNALELGCYEGEFTRKFLKYFDSITCVDASNEAIEIAKEKIKSSKVEFVHSMFEDAKLSMKYKNIFLTHVLEHVDDRVGLLKKINYEWIDDDGVLFVACPNANAPSRQIAVKMGLLESNCSVTDAEYEHGHRITYSFDTLEMDIKKSGLKILHKSGIFFKALANFQWDALLNTNIISEEYLQGCYELGQQYPELCSSIYFVCGKGK